MHVCVYACMYICMYMVSFHVCTYNMCDKHIICSYISLVYITKYIIFELDLVLDRFLIFREFEIDKIKILESIYTI